MDVTARVHRFRDTVAVCFTGVDGVTVYLSASEARALSDTLNRAAESVETTNFIESNFAPVEIPLAWRHR